LVATATGGLPFQARRARSGPTCRCHPRNHHPGHHSGFGFNSKPTRSYRPVGDKLKQSFIRRRPEPIPAKARPSVPPEAEANGFQKFAGINGLDRPAHRSVTRSRDVGKDWSGLPSHLGRQTELLWLMEPCAEGNADARSRARLPTKSERDQTPRRVEPQAASRAQVGRVSSFGFRVSG